MSDIKKTTALRYRRHIIAEALPGEHWGTGGIGLADFTGNGILDVAVSRRETQTAYWFRRENDGTWSRHDMGVSDRLKSALGATALDVDHDGHIDVVFGGVWFKNPGCLDEDPDAKWGAIEYDGGGHDIVAADVNSDGRDDLIVYDGKTLAWFDTSDGMKKHVVSEGRNDHGGVAPHGFGDIAGNGRVDIVVPGVWFENPGNGDGHWTAHPWPHRSVDRASYGTSIRCWVADMNQTGLLDIVYSNCDTAFSHVYWVENLGGGRSWKIRCLPNPPGDPRTGSFHSLGVADFNRDGVLDIFAGEQEDASHAVLIKKNLQPMKPNRLKERGVIWVNSGGADPVFEPVVIHEGWPGWHDAVLGDVNGNGRLGIVSKVWNTDWNDGPKNYHVDWWEPIDD